MNDRIQQMLAEAYELEGLLLLCGQRGSDTPQAVADAIREKIESLRLQAVGIAPAEQASECPPQEEPECPLGKTADEPAEIKEEDTAEYAFAEEALQQDEYKVDEEEECADDESADDAFTEAYPGEPTLRLDEVLSQKMSKDLRSAFSINDTFRFRRELFANSAAEMTDVLHLVEAMRSFDEAEEYFYGDLGWDAESDEVKEFMTIIKNHFA